MRPLSMESGVNVLELLSIMWKKNSSLVLEKKKKNPQEQRNSLEHTEDLKKYRWDLELTQGSSPKGVKKHGGWFGNLRDWPSCQEGWTEV